MISQSSSLELSSLKSSPSLLEFETLDQFELPPEIAVSTKLFTAVTSVESSFINLALFGL